MHEGVNHASVEVYRKRRNVSDCVLLFSPWKTSSSTKTLNIYKLLCFVGKNPLHSFIFTNSFILVMVTVIDAGARKEYTLCRRQASYTHLHTWQFSTDILSMDLVLKDKRKLGEPRENPHKPYSLWSPTCFLHGVRIVYM